MRCILDKEDLVPAEIEDFFNWINERHRIYENRFTLKLPKPWTKDEIFQQFKFTNVFRQLDTGTIALDRMLGKWFNNPAKLQDMEVDDAIDILFNIVWYRLFNLADHAIDIGFTKHKDHDIVRRVLVGKKNRGEKVFTSAHMTSGSGEHVDLYGKVYGHLVGPIGIAEDFGEQLISYIFYHQSLQEVTKKLTELPSVGPFIAYEIACDLRFTPLLSGATDKLSWANMGPGARRGLMRLDMVPLNESMVKLYEMALRGRAGYDHPRVSRGVLSCKFPFELREIEHSLCEFDKYMRVKTGAGRPRQNYEGI